MGHVLQFGNYSASTLLHAAGSTARIPCWMPNTPMRSSSRRFRVLVPTHRLGLTSGHPRSLQHSHERQSPPYNLERLARHPAGSMCTMITCVSSPEVSEVSTSMLCVNQHRPAAGSIHTVRGHIRMAIPLEENWTCPTGLGCPCLRFDLVMAFGASILLVLRFGEVLLGFWRWLLDAAAA